MNFCPLLRFWSICWSELTDTLLYTTQLYIYTHILPLLQYTIYIKMVYWYINRYANVQINKSRCIYYVAINDKWEKKFGEISITNFFYYRFDVVLEFLWLKGEWVHRYLVVFTLSWLHWTLMLLWNRNLIYI